MQVRRLSGSAEAYNVHYLRKSVLTYLSGQYDWKWVMAVIRQSGLRKREVLSVLTPLKGQGWRFRSQALFSWLEEA
jgi:hypothetical protein